MRVLFVCTANICRSPSAQWLLRDAVAGSPELTGRVEVRSAGTHALAGAQGCPVAAPMTDHWADHRAAPLTRELTAWADLILPMAREHRTAISELDPSTRSRTFTLRQAGRTADWVRQSGATLSAPDGAPLTARGLVAELDALRGHLPTLDPAQQPSPPPRWRLGGREAKPAPVHPDDVPDPHVLGSQWHPATAELLRDCVDSLVAVLRLAQ